MKAVVSAFNQEKALVGAFSVIVQPVGSVCSTTCDGGGPGDEVRLEGEVLRHLERRGVVQQVSPAQVQSVVQELGTVDPEQWKQG